MGQTREQRIINQVLGKPTIQLRTPIATDMFIPNHSGMSHHPEFNKFRPVGEITMYGGAIIPVDWLLCNGIAVSRTTYAALFAAIGTTWGAGDGSTTFNIPDLSLKFPYGAGAGVPLGNFGGSATHNDHLFVGTVGSTGLPNRTTSITAGGLSSVAASNHSHAFTPEGTVGLGSNIPPYKAVYFIIKT